MSISLNLSVLPESRSMVSGQSLWEQNETWAKTTAMVITHKKAAMFPSHKEDWASDALVHLWQNRGLYEVARGPQNWRAWAYYVMQNRITDLIEAERYRRSMLTSTSRTAGLLTEPPSVDSAMVSAVKTQLIIMHRESLARDVKALHYLAESGDTFRVQGDVRDMLGVDMDTTRESLGRIREAMIAVGIGEVA